MGKEGLKDRWLTITKQTKSSCAYFMPMFVFISGYFNKVDQNTSLLEYAKRKTMMTIKSRRILNTLTGGGNMSDRSVMLPEVMVFAGPNGSGKSISIGIMK